MLQQTQVSRVVPYYRRFVRRFPTMKALAEARESDVLAAWQGLGYYRRARNLHAAAKMLRNEFSGRLPRETEELMRLPGVGKYTAGALASIVYQCPTPLVDGNVERVLLRLAGRRFVDRHSTHAFTWNQAAQLVTIAANPGEFNEALMELGATICLPNPSKPRCGACPLARHCAASRLNRQHLIPAATKRGLPRVQHHHALIVTRSGSDSLLIEQRSRSGMWGGMWQTPTIESDSQLSLPEIHARTKSLGLEDLRFVASFAHRTTHRALLFHVLVAQTRLRKGIWRTPKTLEHLPLSNAHRRVLRSAGILRVRSPVTD